MIIKKLIKSCFEYFARIFYWASGADMEILNQVPIEKNKYFGIGGTVIFTALMASFAGSYAVFTVFKDESIALYFGLFWGALILNLDRYIVTTLGAGDENNAKSKLKSAIPRLIMAFVLGIVIATPLELKLFEKEINAKIAEEIAIAKRNNEGDGQDSPVLKTLVGEKQHIEEKINERNQTVKSKRADWVNANKDKNDEYYYGKFSGKAGSGETYDDYKKTANEAESDYKNLKSKYTDLNNKDYTKIDSLNVEIGKKKRQIALETDKINTVYDQNDGFLARIKALSLIRSQDDSVNLVIIMITLLFVLIEIAPVLFKIMTARGAYDDIADRIRYEVKVGQMLKQSNFNQEVNSSLKIHSDKNEHRLSAELLANKQLLNSIVDAQSEIAEIAVNKWKMDQIEAVKKKPAIVVN